MTSLAIIKDSCFINLVLLVLEPNKCFNGFTIVIVGCVSLLLVLSPSCVNATMFGCLTNRKHWVTKALRECIPLSRPNKCNIADEFNDTKLL